MRYVQGCEASCSHVVLCLCNRSVTLPLVLLQAEEAKKQAMFYQGVVLQTQREATATVSAARADAEAVKAQCAQQLRELEAGAQVRVAKARRDAAAAIAEKDTALVAALAEAQASADRSAAAAIAAAKSEFDARMLAITSECDAMKATVAEAKAAVKAHEEKHAELGDAHASIVASEQAKAAEVSRLAA